MGILLITGFVAFGVAVVCVAFLIINGAGSRSH